MVRNALDAWQGNTRWCDVPLYCLAQIIGAFAGVAAAHLMFGELAFLCVAAPSDGACTVVERVRCHLRFDCGHYRLFSQPPERYPLSAVAAYIAAACWFTASTSFANPAVGAGACNE